jgi:polysaccharide export outer membrane protein
MFGIRRPALVLMGAMATLGIGLCTPAMAQQQPRTQTAATPAPQLQIPDYSISPGDELEVSVWKEPDLSKTVIVRPDGKFSVPLAGEIMAARRSVDQIQNEITNKLKKYIPEAVVTVSITKLEGNRIYVIGQVTKPGAFTMNPRLNVVQALSMAGGMTPFAALNDIIVLRNAGPSQRVLPFRYGDVSKSRNLEQNIQLEAGDVVIVP